MYSTSVQFLHRTLISGYASCPFVPRYNQCIHHGRQFFQCKRNAKQWAARYARLHNRSESNKLLPQGFSPKSQRSISTGHRTFYINISTLVRKRLFDIKESHVNCIVGLASLTGYVTWTLKNTKAYCKAKNQKSRLIGSRNIDKSCEQPDFDWKTFFQLLRPDLLYLISAVVCAVAAAIVNIQIPLVLGEIVNIVSSFTQDVARDFIHEVRQPVIKMIGYYAVQSVLTCTYLSLLSTVGENMAARMRTCLFDSILRQDIEFFDKHKTGELVDRLTSDIQDFKSSFKLCISQGLKASTQALGCVGSMFVISPKLTVAMVTILPAIVGVGTLMGSGLRSMSRSAQEQLAKSTALADEAIGNVRTVRAFAMEEKENELYSNEVEKARCLNIKLGFGIGTFQGLANFALNGIVLGTLFTGGWLMSRQEITAGNLMSFLVASQTIERSLAQMSLLFGNVVRGMSAGARVFEFINTVPSIPLKGGKKIAFHSLMGNVEFEDVSFSYPTRREQTVLKDFNLTIKSGSVVALVGLSGGGKSTVAVLLERFYDIQKGKITIDGYDLKDMDPTWLRGRALGYINQEPVLFATSVMENIRYGKPEASDIEVIEAATLANAHDFISQFPEGYNTVLGERGVTVSGGQKQRIAIARALIKNPSILILDEATSALDAESERIVQEALDKVIKGRTTLVIAHRLSTIRDADVIAVVSGGKIVEMGDHTSLKKKKGLYWELIRQQEIEEEINEFQKYSHF
ncbi:mitochondrial potassium channel ATP-binding subunit-like [Pecten maximus]|uniref:mitochondrial potassium channel ATP-binding subunit-like n=1 Tax=Pecten maximus TaxID=6579 RepID=UPI00145883E7|nr:mitochondrial potassium channel ATP-binding subunit-like [Pecten maximus]XP_033752438.1 mitochondrial potassium channel ATP-binding subunit-like [Pecten maximus]